MISAGPLPMFASSFRVSSERDAVIMDAPFTPGCVVILYLREPRERVCGVLTALEAAGVSIRGMDLSSFDAWLRARGDPEECGVVSSDLFYPMGRVQRILKDEDSPGVPGLDARCRERTGRTLRENLVDESAGAAVGKAR